MSKFIDRTGTRIGRLSVLSKYDTRRNKIRWLCKCDCGNMTIVLAESLASGQTKSCGCIHSEMARTKRLDHGQAGIKRSPEYRCWTSMLNRCKGQRDCDIRNYSGRGIYVCDSWKNFKNFMRDMGPRPSPKHSIDRINNNGPYEPGNCRWATMKQQSANKRTNVYVEIDGTAMCLGHACDHLGLSRNMVYARTARYGWSINKALGLSAE